MALLKAIGNAGPSNSLVKYKVTPDGEIQTINPPERNGGSNDRRLGYQASPPAVDDYLKRAVDYPYGSLEEAQSASEQVKQDKKLGALRLDFDRKLADITSQENAKTAAAQQIAALAGPGLQNNLQASNMQFAGGTPSFNEQTGRDSLSSGFGSGVGGVASAGQPMIQPTDFIRSTELQEIGEVVRNATKYENGTSRVNAILPSAEVPPKGAIQYSFGAKGRELNPDYDPEVAKKWQEKQRTYLYEQLSKYTGADEANKLKTRYDQIYSVSNLQADPSISSKLNFQVSDDQILNDYNISKLSRYNKVVDQGNIQAVGIQERLTAAQKLLDTLPADSAQRTASDVYVDGLKKDLASVRSAISDATNKIRSFKPLAVGSTDAAKEITSFRSFLQLPEERATQQLRQIDPDSYDASVELGKRYRALATEDIGPTQTAQTEQLRGQLEQEAINQLALGSQLGAEEQRQYQQAARAAQTARGNIFGVAPAVEEAVTTGAAGEQRKLARYGAATQFLASGQNTSDALKSDIAFRDALLQNRLGAASGFIAGGPSIYNLSQARTAQQQNAMQNYIQANQALPGGFNQQPSTAQPFYQAVDQGIPVNLTNTFANLYGSQANYLANTYGARVGALSRAETGSQAFGNIASGLGNLFSFNKAF